MITNFIIEISNKCATMIPIQKPTKVPGQTLEGDKLIMSKDLLEKLLLENKSIYNFLIVDDVVATGGVLRL